MEELTETPETTAASPTRRLSESPTEEPTRDLTAIPTRRPVISPTY